MKRLLLLSLLVPLFIHAQTSDTTCITIKGARSNPGFTQVNLISTNNTAADTSQQELISEAWTCNADGFPSCNFRALIRYDLSAIPAGVYVTSAKLYLYAKSNALNGNHVDPTYGSDNTSLLQKVTAPWTAAGVGWLAQPPTTTASQKTLAQSTSTHQNYVVNVKDFVQSWINTPASNHGMMLKLQNEVAYNSMIFNSGLAADSLQPTLVICYTTTPPPPSNDTCVTIKGDTAGHAFTELQFATFSDNTGDTSQTEIVSEAWTCNSMGYPTCNFRAILKYDVSSIPSDATVTSAKLYLYAKPNASNGDHVNPTYGTANASLFQKVTQPWTTTGTGWLNQPATTTISQKTLPQSTSNQQNYIVNVTDFVQGWVAHPETNYGAMLRLKDETYYNSMIFYSGQAPANLKPRLVICYTKSVLALSVRDFQYTKTNGNIGLSWKISDGTSLSSIGIEKSANGSSFDRIGNINAVSSTSDVNYSFVDNKVAKTSPNAYYRLALNTKDGKTSYSNVLMVELDDAEGFRLSPNPAKGSVQLSLKAVKAGKADVAITDSYGRFVGRYSYQFVEGSNSVILNSTQNLASGMYIVRVSINGQVLIKKFVKQ